MPTPLLITESLIDEINAVVHSYEIPSEFTLRKWERDARALTKKGRDEAADGYQLLGMIATVKCAPDDIEMYFKKALDLKPDSSIIAENLYTALCNILLMRKSYELMMELHRERVLGIEGISDTEFAHMLTLSGHVQTARNLLCNANDDEILKKTKKGGLTVGWVDKVIENLKKASLSENHLSLWVDCAVEAVREKVILLNIPPWQVRVEFEMVPEAGPIIKLLVPTNVEIVVDLNFTVADALGELDIPTVHNLPIISVMTNVN
ncbi:Uncharacterised protein [Chromobacterium violaceum]|uniref:Uncharacterized protein n=1 Tax=Chromobacterium violaceum TaxID=536 RepID=A0A3S4LIF0_CHRVL|nr:Uncharacterised protein [Chromobacterium violaceum]